MFDIGDLLMNKKTGEIATIIYKMIDNTSYLIEFNDGKKYHLYSYVVRHNFKKVHAVCPKCGHFLEPSDLKEYKFLCKNCDENFYSIEVKQYI